MSKKKPVNSIETTYAGMAVVVVAKPAEDSAIGKVKIKYDHDGSSQWVPLGALGELPRDLNVHENLPEESVHA